MPSTDAAPWPDLGQPADQLDDNPSLDRLVEPLRSVADAVLPAGRAKDALHGSWLGHPLHPLLTDLPIGFWTSAFVLDLVGGKRSRTAADRLVALGVLSAVPTAAAGLADWSELRPREQRSGAVHAAANATATALYGLSYVARKRGRRLRGVALAMAGATAATVGGYLGGHLSFRRASGVNQVAFAASPDEWTPASFDEEPAAGRLVAGRVEDTPVVAVGDDVLAARCSHLGGPLPEGELVDGCVRCPWHGSTFRLADGSVARGPATAPQPAYEARRDGDGWSLRRRPR